MSMIMPLALQQSSATVTLPKPKKQNLPLFYSSSKDNTLELGTPSITLSKDRLKPHTTGLGTSITAPTLRSPETVVQSVPGAWVPILYFHSGLVLLMCQVLQRGHSSILCVSPFWCAALLLHTMTKSGFDLFLGVLLLLSFPVLVKTEEPLLDLIYLYLFCFFSCRLFWRQQSGTFLIMTGICAICSVVTLLMLVTTSYTLEVCKIQCCVSIVLAVSCTCRMTAYEYKIVSQRPNVNECNGP